MATALKKNPRHIEKAKDKKPKMVCDVPKLGMEKIASVEAENAEAENAEAEISETEAAEVTNPVVKADQNGGLDLNKEDKKPNPDFEPEFDGDLEHVSWVPMKLFGEHKGF